MSLLFCFFSLLVDLCYSQNDFWTQPNVLKCVRESSELHVIQLFNNCLVSAAKQQDVETVQRPQTIESEPHQSPLAQPSNEDETGINTVNSAYASNLKEFLGQPPARQVSNDEQEEGRKCFFRLSIPLISPFLIFL